MVDFPRLPRLDNEAGEVALAGGHEVAVDGRGREEGGKGGVTFVDASVAQDDEAEALVDPGLGFGAEATEGSGEEGARRILGASPIGFGVFPRAAGRGHEDGDDGDAKIGQARVAEPPQVRVGKEGVEELELPAVIRRFVEKVFLGADVVFERHDQVFPVGVDGGIRHLGEKLAEIRVEGQGKAR
jgi:hypothetical protein